ncbi:MAG: tetratricopeptide repeat protein [Verrucomicrobia bacterium]|nr:MAG: tetratricopeptide repeat protein [Verrucomicrobiota bacterium]
MHTELFVPRLTHRQLVLSFAIVLGMATGSWAAEASPLDALRAEMRAEHYEQAGATADKLIAANAPKADEACYLKALALFQAKKFAAVITEAGQLASAFPASDWRFKATFLQAQALVEQKKFQEAAAIYQGEAARLLAAGRKQELVSVIVAFADKLTTTPDTHAPDAPKPDFQKAYNLYTKALGMEISRDLRDELVFKKARAIQQAGNFPQAALDLQAYLTEFEPTWNGPAGSGTPRLPLQNPPPAGKHAAWARYRLAEAQIQANNIAAGRMELEDLLKMLDKPLRIAPALQAELLTAEGKNLPAEIRWLMVQAYFTQQGATTTPRNTTTQVIGNTGGLPTSDVALFVLHAAELDQAIKTCRDFLTAFPEGSRAVRAAWMIAEAYQSAGRADDAIQAYRDFIAGEGFHLAEGEPALKYDEDLHAAPATHLANLKMRALFRIGALLAQQKKREDAIATWQSYVKDYPNGPQWSDSQNAIIDAEFQMGMDALTDKTEALAVQRFDEFLGAHPLDLRSPRILYLFGAIHEAKAHALEKAKGELAPTNAAYRQAIEEWTKLVSKYPQSPEARIALMKSAAIHEEKFAEFEQALQLYRKLVGEFNYPEANASVARLTGKSLDLSAERTFRTNEPAVVKLKLRNIEKCTFRLHEIDLQAYFRKMHGITGVEKLDVSLIQPDKTWDFKPEGYVKYKPFEQEVKIPFPSGEAGAYVVTVGDDEWESTVLVLRSDLEVIVKSSRRELLAFVQNMLTGKPAADVDILVSDGKAVAATGKTGDDGVFKTQLESLKDLADLRLFAIAKGHAASFNLDLAGLQLTTGLSAKGYLYTDRPVYQPGESVALRGILRELRNAAYAVPENSEFKLSISDPQGRLLSEQSVKTSRFGTFDSSLVLPAITANGTYVMAAHQERKGLEALHFQGSFEVRSFKLEKIKLAMEFARRVWFRGETIEATLQAAFYWGEPLAGRALRCSLPDGRSLTVTTDAAGKAKLSFDTTSMRPGSALTFSATLDGDNLSTSETLTLARLGFTIAAKPSQAVVIAGEPFDLSLTTTAADGQSTGQALKLTVLRIEQAKTRPVLALLPWSDAPTLAPAEVTHSELDLKTDPATGKVSVPLTLEKGGLYRLRTTGSDRFGQPIIHECQIVVSDADDAVKLRLFADTATLKVGKETRVRLHSRLTKGLALVTFEGETILRHRIIELKKDDNDLSIKVGHDLFPNFRLAVSAMDGRDLRSATKDFDVERQLKVCIKPLKDAFTPGEEAKVELSVTDQTGQPVEAELSLALVNEALFAVCPDPLTPILSFFQQDARRHAEFKLGATCAFHYQGSTHPVSKAVTDEASRLTRSEAERAKLDELRKAMAANNSKPRVVPPASGRSRGGAAINGVDARSMTNAPADGESLHETTDDFGGATADFKELTEEPKPGEKSAAAVRREVKGEGRWLPSLITGADGKVIASMVLPETTNAWRLTARGCTVETLVGQTTAQTLTRKDFFVELKTPALLREGDELRVVGRLHNLTDYAGPVDLKLRVLDAKDKTKVLAEREKSVDVLANSGGEVAFDRITVPAALEIILELSGSASPNATALKPPADALTLTIPVRPWGLPYTAHAGGSAKADAVAVLGLPAQRAYSSCWMSVAIGPDVRTAVLDMALRRSGTGACEDMARLLPPQPGDTAANDLLAAATALRYANTGKVNGSYTQQLSSRARALVAALVASQAADGNWTCQALGQLTTARVFWALIEARQSGIVVNKDSIDKAAAALLKQFEACDANDNDSKAVILHALSTDKQADFANCNRLYRERNSLGNSSLAHLARAFFNLERREIATELAKLLESKFKAEPDKLFVWDGGCKTVWLNDRDETTAMVLLAMAETLPTGTATAAAAQALLQAHGCFGFPNPRAQGPAVAALSTWFAQGLQQATDIEIAVVVNGKEIGSVKAVASLGQHLLAVPNELVKADKNLVEFKLKGRGRYTYAATLCGFSPEVKATPINIVPRLENVQHLHAQLEYRGKPIGAGSSSPVKALENGQRLHVVLSSGRGWNQDGRRYALEISLPPGTRLDEASLSANAAELTGREITDSTITLFFNRGLHQVNFDLTGYVPGTFRMLPPVIRELGNPAFMSIGPVTELTVLAAGEKSPDVYQMNDAEHYALGKCAFEDGDLAGALEHLASVRANNPQYNESELARMLLWIHTSAKFYDAHKIVEMFELLRERFPQLEIPYDKILVVGKAYTDIGEFERSWLVYRAAIAASFNNDSAISAVLEDEGRFLGSIDFQERIWREYPDSAEVIASHFALSQLIYQKAPKANELPKEDGLQPEKTAMLKRSADLLLAFLAMYPQDPLADDAGFSLTNCLLTLKNYPLVVSLANEFAKKYPDSPLAPGFQYISALGLFWQNEYAEALAAAKVVADGDSKDRDFARYILGQIYHAEGKPKDAIEWYTKVRDIYPDAGEAIAYFEKKSIALDEITVVKPGEPVELTLKYRNIKEVSLQVYRVDLMQLYLQQKNLSAITSVQLAGIRPELEQTTVLGDGKDFIEKERKLSLQWKNEAAYLIICRGDDLFTSGMVLITPLKIEVQQDTTSGRVRANVLDTVKGGYRPEVHVKAIGSADTEFRSGETDLRGLFIADNVHGKATVIAREGESRYAFFRGDTWLGSPPNTPASVPQPAGPQGQQLDYQNNLNEQNDKIQMFNNSKFNQQRRQAPNKGVQMKQAF